eukprot:6056795-Amphidinium_carterae.1
MEILHNMVCNAQATNEFAQGWFHYDTAWATKTSYPILASKLKAAHVKQLIIFTQHLAVKVAEAAA